MAQTLLFLLLFTQNSASNPYALFNNDVNEDLTPNDANNNTNTNALDGMQSGNHTITDDEDDNNNEDANDDSTNALQRFDAKQALEQSKISDRHWNENSKRGKYNGDAVSHTLVTFLTRSGTDYDSLLNLLRHVYNDKNITPLKMKFHSQLNMDLSDLGHLLLQALYDGIFRKCGSNTTLLRSFRAQLQGLLQLFVEFLITTKPRALNQVLISTIMTDTPLSQIAAVVTKGWLTAANSGKNAIEIDSIRYVPSMICMDHFVMQSCIKKQCILMHDCPCGKSHTALTCPKFELSEANKRNLVRNLEFNKNLKSQFQSSANNNLGSGGGGNRFNRNNNRNNNYRRNNGGFNREYRRQWQPNNGQSPYNRFMGLARPQNQQNVAPAQPAQPRRQ